VADDAVDTALQRLRDRSARVIEREASLRDWLTEEFVKRDDEEREENDK
jgi:hypothetical protein